jgi:hypothetical protein
VPVLGRREAEAGGARLEHRTHRATPTGELRRRMTGLHASELVVATEYPVHGRFALGPALSRVRQSGHQVLAEEGEIIQPRDVI